MRTAEVTVAYIRRVHRSPGLAAAASLLTATSAVLLAGCSSPKHATPSTPTKTTSVQTTESTAPVEIGISPGGVTTSLSAPASSTEEEYYQACHCARLWMNGQPGDPRAQIEPYLKMIQASPTGQNGTWHIPWSQLPLERQAAIIVAVQGAANAACD
jgi:hypothetical protein